jgi:hypothetical protein
VLEFGIMVITCNSNCLKKGEAAAASTKKKTTKIAPERGSSVQDKAQEAWRAVE